jgi:hypothetical protein
MAKETIARVPTRRIKLEVFNMHAHRGSNPVNYSDLLNDFSKLPAALRFERIADRIIVVQSFIRQENGSFFFRAYSGSPGSKFLLLEPEQFLESVASLQGGRFIAAKTLGVIEPDRREAIIQYVHGGVTAMQVSALIEKVLRAEYPDRWKDLTFEFAYIPGASFRDELARFERIQSASVKLTRPNPDWTDYSDKLLGLGDDSGARDISVSATAPRNGTLAREHGVIRIISGLMAQAKSILKSASVTGVFGDDDELISINLKTHAEAKFVRLPADASIVNDADLTAELNRFLEERRGKE